MYLISTSPAKHWIPDAFFFIPSIVINFALMLGAGATWQANLPFFSKPLQNMTVTIGRNVSLPCSVQNLGDHQVAWIHLERNMVLTVDDTMAARIPKYNLTFEHDRTQWNLHIINVQEEDGGGYMCQLNTSPQMDQVCYIQVVVPPSIIDKKSSPSSVSLNEGSSVELKCEAYGKPHPEIFWKREDERPIKLEDGVLVQEARGRRLLLQNVSRWDMAAYLCIAKNGIQPSVSKRILVDILFPPVTNATIAQTSIPLNHNAVLQCVHEGNPSGKHFWTFNHTFIFDGTRHSIRTTSKNHRTTSVLRIQKVLGSDFGRYECVARNQLGESRGSIVLKGRDMDSKPVWKLHDGLVDEESGSGKMTHPTLMVLPVFLAILASVFNAKMSEF